MKANHNGSSNPVASRIPVHPSVFTLLLIPYGIMSGYVTVTLAYLYTKGGIPLDKVAELVAVILLPHIFKFIWAPLVDSTLSLKKWCYMF